MKILVFVIFENTKMAENILEIQVFVIPMLDGSPCRFPCWMGHPVDSHVGWVTL